MSSEPRKIRPGEGGLSRSERDEIVLALSRGELVALPTETVYGIAARASAQALPRLAEAKGRPQQQGFTWHVSSPAALEAFPRGESSGSWALTRRLAQRYWPGPLTLVLRGEATGAEILEQGGWTGVRCPAQPACEAVLEACDFPVAMSSLNLHGEAPVTDLAALPTRFGGVGSPLSLLVDDGPARLAEPSTVLALGPGRFEVLRRGLIDENSLRQAAGMNIAFVCTGNTCRSPLAEGIARRMLAEKLGVGDDELHRFGFDVSSFGAFAMPGAPAADHTVEVLAREGIDLSSHRSRPADPKLLAGLDRIYGLTRGHLAALEGQVPENAQLELLDPLGHDVPDPIGQGEAAYVQTAEVIREALKARLAEWV